MGVYVFKLPDVGEGTAEAEVVAWHVAVGDRVEEDAPLVDVMTDKATVEMTSPVGGRVLKLNGAPGEMAAVGSALVEIETEGAGGDVTDAPLVGNPAGERSTDPRDPPPTTPLTERPTWPGAADAPSTPTPAAPAPLSHGAGEGKEARSPSPAPQSGVGEVARGTRDGGGSFSGSPAQRGGISGGATLTPPGQRPLASPAVRRRALDLNVKLEFVPGSGPAGRIEHADLDAFLARSNPPPLIPEQAGTGYAPREGVAEVKVIGLRRKIAEKMQEAKRRIPHFAYVEEVDMTELEELRARLNVVHKDRGKLTVLPFFMRALVRVLPDYPQINAVFDDEAGVVRRHAAVHIGIATQTAGGLIVPVVRHAEALDLWAAAREVARVSTAARDNKAARDELSGSTITLTSLGPLGGIATTPVINHPEVAIIGPNKIVDRPVVRGGQVVVRKMMNLSSSFDHRVVDGYDAAEFIQRVKGMLEHPATLFIQ